MTVLTLNVDDNPGLVQPVLNEKGYSFPVLFASEWIRKTLDEVAIPRTWIVDPAGTLRYEQVGFDFASDKWLDQTIERLASVTEKPSSP